MGLGAVVSEERVSFNFWMERISELRTLAVTSILQVLSAMNVGCDKFLRNVGSDRTHTTAHPK
jgi:hypothetical protein